MIASMPRPKLPHLQHERNRRNGSVMWYVRVNRKLARIRIRGDYGSESFMADYRAAITMQSAVLAGTALPPSKTLGKAPRGSLRWLCDRWRESSDWFQTAKSTQRQRENILLHILDKNGDLRFADLTKAEIVKGRERRMTTPFAANNYLKTVKALFAWAVKADIATSNPAVDVEFLSRKTTGHEPWTSADVASYRARWQVGTRERLAMELLYWTGLRRGDVVRLGRQHIGADGMARLKTEKTGKVVSVFMSPLLPLIEASPTGDLVLIAGESGRPLAKESFGTLFHKWCVAAKVTKSAHGLRKLAAIEVAEAGGSEMHLKALFGWESHDQSAVYTRNARQEMLSKEASMKRDTNISIPVQAFTYGKEGK